MKITDLLTVKAVDLNASAASKEEILKKAVDLMEKQGNVTNKEEYLKAVFAREEESTTGVGDGIAIPHGRCDGISKPGLIAMVIPEGVEYEALDDEPVNLLFLIAADTKSGSAHIDILSKLSGMLMHDEFTAALKAAKTPEEFLKVIDDAEAEKDAKEEAPKAVAQAGQKKILAVTGCPTGIAHTFMAAEAIEKAAKARGCFVKVETRGSGGAKNVLTDAEIAEADCIIVAADTKVPMGRFNGKKLIEVPVSDGISKADKLVDRAINGDASVYQGGGEEKASSESKGSIGHQIYKHLMNGVSHMLPFVVGGGILIALAFLIDGFLVDLNNISQDILDKFPATYVDEKVFDLRDIPEQFRDAYPAVDVSASESLVKSNFGSITAVAGLLKSIGGVAFGFMLPILAGFIAMSIADRPGLAVGFLGGALAANGTSGFLGALVAGFIAGYVVKLLMALTNKMPKALDGIRPVLIYPLFGMFITGLCMVYAIEPVVGKINTALNDGLASMNGVNSILLGIVVAGMMAIDMGGPFNKASYAFGLAAIAAGNYNIMAAVMIGGMVPPCAIALSTILFKKKYNATERKNGPTNFVMGLAFITEGAIPYAAADPIRVIPSCMIASGLAGALSMAFKCTLMAPHGGIFVFPVVGNAALYLLSLVIATVVGAVILGLVKKTVEE